MTPPGAEAPRAPAVAARRLDGGGPPPGEFTYAVLEALPPVAGERRAAPRRRTRLRSGKVVAADGRFLVECLIANRSTGGGLLRLPAPTPLADRLLVYEDGTGELLAALVVWRRGRDVGVRFRALPAEPRLRALAEGLRRKFYAVRG